ncbi:hypothetical protein AB0269_07435 [Microbacterium sp. NPDC077644]|uniref:hypothetical protein n=1 Tax=Microbacterium sp. NPDC077644 TaxID=3155055 RepID=UPI00344F1B0D
MVRIKWLDNVTTTNGRSALLLPGAGYTAQAPLLYWSVAVLLSAGWRVGAAEWEDSDREFANPYELIDRTFELHASEASAQPDLVVAKSLGTLALPRCISRGIAGVWLTPLLNMTEVATALLSADRRHLAIGGTKDRHWIPETVQGTNAKLITLDDVDHALLHDDWRTSMQLHSDVAAEVDAHVQEL